jgi:HEAT repeat protein
LIQRAGLSDDLHASLAASLGGLKDPKAVPALKRLLEANANDQNITKGAAIALRQSGSAEALWPLSRLLTNNNQRVRYYAVVGMGEITRQDEWTPAFPEFLEHEGKYLSHWRDWAASNVQKEPRN